ncbi:MAG: hypothetical protein V2A73_11130, partial [Pseudomonadota bacterium]
GWNVGVLEAELESWRIIGTSEHTSIQTSLPDPNDHFYLSFGKSVTFQADRDFVIEADGPISVGQFPSSQEVMGIPPHVDGGKDPPGGDPSFILVPPVEQWRSKYVFLVPNKYAYDFLLMAVPVGTKILYDDFPLSTVLQDCEYQPISKFKNSESATEYQAIRCPLSHPTVENPNDPAFQDDGRHELESLDGQAFGLVVFGLDRYVSYGYPGGTNLAVINPD